MGQFSVTILIVAGSVLSDIQQAGSHMVYVREGPDTLDVIRVLHQRQDVERNL